MSEKKWALRDGRPVCRNCGSLLKPIDEPAGLKCDKCGSAYPLTDLELAELTFDLSD